MPMMGCILSVVIKVSINCTSLLRPADSNDIVIKLKWKAAYLGHILFKPVLASFVKDFLEYLTNNDHLKSDTDINANDVPMNLQYFETELDIYIDKCFRTTALS